MDVGIFGISTIRVDMESREGCLVEFMLVEEFC